MRPDNSTFEQEYRARKSVGAAGLYDSYDADIAHLTRILQGDHAPKKGVIAIPGPVILQHT